MTFPIAIRPAAIRPVMPALSALLALSVMTGGAQAQIDLGAADTVVESQSADVFHADGLIVFEGRVDVVQDQTQLRADRLELYFERSDEAAAQTAPTAPTASADDMGMGDLTHAIAIGAVYYVTPERVATGDHAYYDIVTDTVTMTGRVIVQQGCDVLTGEQVVLNLTTNDAQVRAGESVDNAARPARVRTLIRSSGGTGGETGGEGGCL